MVALKAPSISIPQAVNGHEYVVQCEVPVISVEIAMVVAYLASLSKTYKSAIIIG